MGQSGHRIYFFYLTCFLLLLPNRAQLLANKESEELDQDSRNFGSSSRTLTKEDSGPSS